MTKRLMIVRMLIGIAIFGYIIVRCGNLLTGFLRQTFSLSSHQRKKRIARFAKRVRHKLRIRKSFSVMYRTLVDRLSSSSLITSANTRLHSAGTTDKTQDPSPKDQPQSQPSIQEPDSFQQQQIKKILYDAKHAQDKGNFTDYEQKLIEGLAVFPYHPECNRRLAGYYVKTDNAKKAISLLKKVLQYMPQDHEAIWQLGDIYLQEGDFPKAQKLIHKAIRLANDRPKYYVSMVEIMYNTNRLDEAISYMQKAVTLRPANVNYLTALGELYEEKEDIENAKKYYFQVLEHEPSNAEAKKRLNRL